MTKMRIALGVVALGVAVSSTAVVATEPPAPAEFAIPAERFTALDEAGLGWMFEGVEYPAQPDGVPWPTDEWPTADLPEGVDDASSLFV